METERNKTKVVNLTKKKDRLMTEVLEERCTYLEKQVSVLEEQVRELNDRLTHLEKQCEFDRTVLI